MRKDELYGFVGLAGRAGKVASGAAAFLAKLGKEQFEVTGVGNGNIDEGEVDA